MNQLSRNRKTLFALVLCALGSGNSADAQGTPSPVILQVDVENIVNYVDDPSDPSQLASVKFGKNDSGPRVELELSTGWLTEMQQMEARLIARPRLPNW
jgi:hypothetical protein